LILVMVAIALTAPCLHPKPSEIIRRCATDTRFEQIVRLDDGTTRTVIYRMGTDSLGRDIYSAWSTAHAFPGDGATVAA